MKSERKTEIEFTSKKSILRLSHKFANLFFVDIFLNEHRVAVMFDTGASVTVVNESIIHLLNAEITDSTVKAGGSAGNIRDYKTAIVKTLRIGNNVVSNHEVIIVPNEVFEFGFDDNGNSFPAEGVLGWDIISLFKWTIDDKKGNITIEQSQPKDPLHNLSWDKFPIINAIYKGNPIKFGFDCGHTESILDEGMADKLNDLHTSLDTTAGMDGMNQEEGNVITEFIFSIQDVQIALKDVVVLKRHVFGQSSEDMMGLLGADIVFGKYWEIDYPNKSFCLL